MKLTKEYIDNLMKECLMEERDPRFNEISERLKSGEDVEGFIFVHGVMFRVAFEQKKIDQEREVIAQMLNQLPEEFHKEEAGYSFLYACMDRDENQWGEHGDIDALICLGLAAGMVKFPFPREVWGALPGGVPYFSVNTKAEKK